MNTTNLDESQPIAHLKYRPDIDGLRAIAVFAVVGFHAFPESFLFVGGFTGVDIFFVISGFLISTSLFQDFSNYSFSLINFYKRRILRIFPALIVVLTVCLVVGYITLFANELKQIGKHTSASVAFISNIVFWNESGYFDNSANSKPLLHLWSLGIEEQFYLIWPLVLWVTYKKKIKLLVTVIVLLAISFVLNIVMVNVNPVEAFFSPLTRFWELLIGSLLAYITINTTNKNKLLSIKSSNIISIFGILLLVISFLFVSEKKAFPGYLALISTVGTAMIIFAGSHGFINSKILSNRLLIWFGLISYPLYLWHWPILTFIRIFDGSFREISNEERFFAVGLAIFLSWLTYEFIEKPIRFGGGKQLKSLILLLLISIVGTFGWQVYLNDGYAERIKFEPKKAVVLFEQYPHPQRNINCENIYPELKSEFSCLLSKPKEAEIALIGDSHAHMYYQSLAQFLDKKSVLNFSAPGCLPFNGFLSAHCKEKHRMALDFLTKHKSIKTVYLTGYFSYLSADFKNGNIEGLREAQILNKEHEENFIADGTSFIKELKNVKKDIVLMKDIPDIIFRPSKCIKFESEFISSLRARRKPNEPFPKNQVSPNECVIDKIAYENRNYPYEVALTKISNNFPTMRVFDPHKILCDISSCWIVKDGVLFYWNSDHLTIEGSNKVIDSLVQSTPPLLDLSQ